MEKDCYNNIVANNSSNNDVNDDSYDGGLFKDGIRLCRHIDRWFHIIYSIYIDIAPQVQAKMK